MKTLTIKHHHSTARNPSLYCIVRGDTILSAGHGSIASCLQWINCFHPQATISVSN